MPDPMITTIITTYRRPHFLKRAIKSVLNQTYQNFQICIYDNASNDETSALVEYFARIDSRIKYHCHPENIGMMANYEFAFKQITTPYFNFLSDDDYLLPNFFETALQGFQENPEAAFSACAVVQLTENGVLTGDPLSHWSQEGSYPKEVGLIEMVSSHHKFPIPTGVLFQTELTRNVPPDFRNEIRLYWDPAYLLQLAAMFPITIQKKICAVYAAHPHTFCSSIYTNMSGSCSNIELYIKSTGLTFKKIKTLNITKKNAQIFNKLFKNNITKELSLFLTDFLLTKKYGRTHFAATLYYKNFGFSLKILSLQLRAFFLKGLSILKKTPSNLFTLSTHN